MAVKADSERSGIGTLPKSVIALSEQEGPEPHGWIFSGAKPKYSKA